MTVWELRPASNKKLVISLDANTREEAIAKAKELVYEREGKRYRKWVCSKVRTSELTPELLAEGEEDKKGKKVLKNRGGDEEECTH